MKTTNTPAELKAILKYKLDRRKNYFEWYGFLCTEQKITEHCTGCTETPDYSLPEKKGSGCTECGYTGKIVNKYPVPVQINGHRIEVDLQEKN